MSRKLVSIITPVYNEEENVLACCKAIAALNEKLSADFEFEHIFTDNHSEDQTFQILQRLAKEDRNIRIFRFSRNFGYQRSIYTGLMKARGDAAIQFDCDLQDPTEMIEKFLQEWQRGFKVVYGIRRSRQEGWFDRFLRRCFYYMLNRLSESDIPQGAGDFRLLDRQILEELRRVKDNKIHLRGRIAEMGFSQLGIPYDRLARTAGRSKFNFSKNLALATDALLTHTTFLLRISTYFGLLVFLLSLFGGVGYLIAHFTMGTSWPAGFTTLVILLLAHLGLTSLFLGIMGEYLARVYEQLKVPQGVILEATVDAWE